MTSVSLVWQLGHVGKGEDVFAEPWYWGFTRCLVTLCVRSFYHAAVTEPLVREFIVVPVYSCNSLLDLMSRKVFVWFHRNYFVSVGEPLRHIEHSTNNSPLVSQNTPRGDDVKSSRVRYKNGSMELTWFAPGVINGQQHQINTEHKLEHSWKNTNFLQLWFDQIPFTGALSLTKNKSRYQIKYNWAPFS